MIIIMIIKFLFFSIKCHNQKLNHKMYKFHISYFVFCFRLSRVVRAKSQDIQLNFARQGPRVSNLGRPLYSRFLGRADFSARPRHRRPTHGGWHLLRVSAEMLTQQQGIRCCSKNFWPRRRCFGGTVNS